MSSLEEAKYAIARAMAACERDDARAHRRAVEILSASRSLADSIASEGDMGGFRADDLATTVADALREMSTVMPPPVDGVEPLARWAVAAAEERHGPDAMELAEALMALASVLDPLFHSKDAAACKLRARAIIERASRGAGVLGGDVELFGPPGAELSEMLHAHQSVFKVSLQADGWAWCAGSGDPVADAKRFAGQEGGGLAHRTLGMAMGPPTPNMDYFNASSPVIPSSPGAQQGQVFLDQEPGSPLGLIHDEGVSYTARDFHIQTLTPPGELRLTCQDYAMPCEEEDADTFHADAADIPPPSSPGRGPFSDAGDIPPLAMIRPYFILPAKEAAKAMKVRQQTVTRWMHHYGISQWPHRKLKSLDKLIDGLWLLSNEGARDESEVAAVVALLKKTRDCIENDPSLDIPPRTKRIRQAMFKAKNKRRAAAAATAAARA